MFPISSPQKLLLYVKWAQVKLWIWGALPNMFRQTHRSSCCSYHLISPFSTHDLPSFFFITMPGHIHQKTLHDLPTIFPWSLPLFSHDVLIIPIFHHILPMISPWISRFPQPGHMISVSSRCLDSSISKRLKAVEIRVMSVFKPVVTRAKQTWHVWVHGSCLTLGMELDFVWGWKPVRTCSNHNIYLYIYIWKS